MTRDEFFKLYNLNFDDPHAQDIISFGIALWDKE